MDLSPLRRHLRRGTATAAVTALALTGLVTVAAPPASAATSVSLTGVQANGQVGVAQNLVITAAIDNAPCGSVLAPTATVFSTVSGPAQAVGTATFARCVGNASQYTFQWLPAATGVFYITAQVSGATSNAVRSAIVAVPTTTRITLANVVTVGQPTPVTASVTANNGSLASPPGSIQFSIVGGGNIGGPIPLNNAVPSTTQIQWTPAVLGSQSLIATYIPSSPSFTCGGTCVSAPDTTQVTDTGVKMFLANPPAFSVGIPSTVTAVLSVVPPSGSVRFTVNGANIGSVPVQGNGQATITWTAQAPGAVTIGAIWSGPGSQSATSQEVVVVNADPIGTDQIRIVTTTGSVLTPGATYQVPNGTVVTYTATTASGSPATFTETGPCTLSGNTVRFTQGNGQCRVTATSPGGNGLTATSATIVVNLVPGTQTPRGNVRASGRVNRGDTVTIVTGANNVTNAGQRMTWRVTSGSRFCELRFPSNGNIRLRAVRNGNCDVRGIAQAVDGQWNRLVINRTYRVR